MGFCTSWMRAAAMTAFDVSSLNTYNTHAYAREKVRGGWWKVCMRQGRG